MDLSITIILIILTVLISFAGFNKPAFISRAMFTPYRIKHYQEWDRFVLSGFIHKDYMHLLFNMFTFYFFGGVVEQFLAYRFGNMAGGVLFVVFYLLGIIISDIPTYLKHRDNSYYHALGASGGVASAVFASIILMPLSDICLFDILCLPGFVLGILFLIYSAVQSKKDSDGINHDAHFYGAMFGIIVILILFPQSGANFIQEIISYRPF